MTILRKPGLALSLLILLHPSFSMPSNSKKFSNLQKVGDLKSKQISQLSNPMKNALDEEILLYNLCVEIQQEKQQKFDIFGPFYKFDVEGAAEIPLQCSPCLPKGYPVTWSKITFENFQSDVHKTDGFTANTELVLKSPEVDLSTYYCGWSLENGTEIVTNIWTVEIIPPISFEKISPRNWKPKDSFTQDSFSIQFIWKPWSDCNKCGTAGKRHRLGFCLIHVNKKSPTAPKTEEYEALSVYSSLSCSLLLTIHPEIASTDPELAQHLSEFPKIMVGFCKLSCDYVDFDPDDRFQKAVPQGLRLLYQNRSSALDGGAEGLIDTQSRGMWALNARDFVSGLKDIPITTDYLPEIFAILSLFAIQFYILIQVCRNRTRAR